MRVDDSGIDEVAVIGPMVPDHRPADDDASVDVATTEPPGRTTRTSTFVTGPVVRASTCTDVAPDGHRPSAVAQISRADSEPVRPAAPFEAVVSPGTVDPLPAAGSSLPGPVPEVGPAAAQSTGRRTTITVDAVASSPSASRAVTVTGNSAT